LTSFKILHGKIIEISKNLFNDRLIKKTTDTHADNSCVGRTVYEFLSAEVS